MWVTCSIDIIKFPGILTITTSVRWKDIFTLKLLKRIHTLNYVVFRRMEHMNIFRAMRRNIFPECSDHRQKHHPWYTCPFPHMMLLRNVWVDWKHSSFPNNQFLSLCKYVWPCLFLRVQNRHCSGVMICPLAPGPVREYKSFHLWFFLDFLLLLVIEVTYCHKNVFDSHG